MFPVPFPTIPRCHFLHVNGLHRCHFLQALGAIWDTIYYIWGEDLQNG